MFAPDELASGQVLLRLEGTFDTAEASRLHDTLAMVPAGTSVTVDFRQVRDCHDFAIALLAQEVAGVTGRISLMGLCQHQRRILRYFGVDDASLAEPDMREAAG